MLQHASASTDAFRLIRRRLCRVLRLSTPHLPVLSSAPTNGFMPSRKCSWCLSLARREKLAGERWRFTYVARTALLIRAYGDKTWLARTIPLGSRTELRSGSGTLPAPRHRRQGGTSGLRSGRLPSRRISRSAAHQMSRPGIRRCRYRMLGADDLFETPSGGSARRSLGRRHAKTTPAFGSVAGGQDNALEPIFRAFDVPEPLQCIRAQGETEAGSVRCVHHAVRTDVERLVE